MRFTINFIIKFCVKKERQARERETRRMAASGGRRKCALCLVTFVSFLVMTLLLSAMSSSKEDLRESLSKISTQDIGETAMPVSYTHLTLPTN